MENCFLSWNGIAAELCTGRAEISLMHNIPHPKMRNSKAKVAEDEYQVLAGSSLVSGVIAPKLSTAAPSSGGGILFVILGMGEIFQKLELLEFLASHWLEHLVCGMMPKWFFLLFWDLSSWLSQFARIPSEEEGERVIVVPHVQNDHCRWTLLLSCLKNFNIGTETLKHFLSWSQNLCSSFAILGYLFPSIFYILGPMPPSGRRT